MSGLIAFTPAAALDRKAPELTELELDGGVTFGVQGARCFGGGVKYFAGQSFGLRGHFRYEPTWLNDDDGNDFCDPFGFCQGWLQQIEVGAGVVFRF